MEDKENKEGITTVNWQDVFNTSGSVYIETDIGEGYLFTSTEVMHGDRIIQALNAVHRDLPVDVAEILFDRMYVVKNCVVGECLLFMVYEKDKPELTVYSEGRIERIITAPRKNTIYRGIIWDASKKPRSYLEMSLSNKKDVSKIIHTLGTNVLSDFAQRIGVNILACKLDNKNNVDIAISGCKKDVCEFQRIIRSSSSHA